MYIYIGNFYKVLKDKFMIIWFIIGVWINFVIKWIEYWYLKND